MLMLPWRQVFMLKETGSCVRRSDARDRRESHI
jgi:hypothetical protein